MEDMYYYAPVDIDLPDIAKCLGEAFRWEIILVDDKRDLIVYLDADDNYCRWWERLPADEVLRELEENQAAELLELDPISTFLITYRPPTLALLIPMFKLVLSNYGGVVGCGEWNKNYSFDEIGDLECP